MAITDRARMAIRLNDPTGKAQINGKQKRTGKENRKEDIEGRDKKICPAGIEYIMPESPPYINAR